LAAAPTSLQKHSATLDNTDGGGGPYIIPITEFELTLFRSRNHVFTSATEATEGRQSRDICCSSDHEQNQNGLWEGTEQKLPKWW